MTRLLCVVSIALLCVLVVAEQAAWSAGELVISCEGSRSNGGGARAYQYTLKNTGASPVTLTLFYLGTLDLSPGNYTNWLAPAGFNATATVADWTTLFGLFQTSVMSTTMIKTLTDRAPSTSLPELRGDRVERVRGCGARSISHVRL